MKVYVVVRKDIDSGSCCLLGAFSDYHWAAEYSEGCPFIEHYIYNIDEFEIDSEVVK